MRIFMVTMIFVLLLGPQLLAQNAQRDQELMDTLKKLELRVLQANSPAAKLRQESLRLAREKVNEKDVEQWHKIATKAEWETFRDARIAALRRSLGHFPETPRKVKVVVTRKIAGEGFTVENLIYESRPGIYVTANRYVPQETKQPMPGILIIHSHHNPKTQGELQDMGMTWARLGCLVLIPDMLGHGERRQHPFVNAQAYPEAFKVGRQDYYFRANVAMQLHLIGDSLMGWMVWDLMRGLDLMEQQPNLDRSKLIVLGSVAGGGDPCAVLTALDARVTASVPFNFGGPQPETRYPLPEDAERRFNYLGGGSWESTRNLRLSGRDGFLPWVIVGASAPRGLIYAHEFAWDQKRDPVWARFQKIWGFYHAADKLAFAHGGGAVTSTSPESTHCNNIGPQHRKMIYPSLERWFGIPIPHKEYQQRLSTAELQCWTEQARLELQPKTVQQYALEVSQQARPALAQTPPSNRTVLRDRWLKLLGISDPVLWLKQLQDADALEYQMVTIKDEAWSGAYRFKTQILRHDRDPAIALPVLTFFSAKMKEKQPVVIALAQDGKAGFLQHRTQTIVELLKRGLAVCIPDLRGSGETTAGKSRGRTSEATSLSATEQMHGRTVPGLQLQELMLLMDALSRQGFGPMALWGDSFAEPNNATMLFAVPHETDKTPRMVEPMGSLLALLGGLMSDDRVKAVYLRGGLSSYRAILESPFVYVPHDAVVPGALTVCDLPELASMVALKGKRGMRMEALVDGLNRRMKQSELMQVYPAAKELTSAARPWIVQEDPAAPAVLAEWVHQQVQPSP